MNTKYYNITSLEKNKITKHTPPANKEWKNSVYSYNKNLLKDISLLDDNTHYTMKSYLNSSFFNAENKKSMRMRSFMKRSSTKKIFVSKPEIKQTTNKAIVTFYIFDRENQLYKSNIFMLNKSLNKNNSYLNKTNFLKKIFKRPHKKNLLSLNIRMKDIRHLRDRKYLVFKNQVANFKANYNLLPKKIMPSFIDKQLLLKDLFIYSFLKWILEKSFRLNINKYCSNCKNTNLKGTFCLNCNKSSTRLALLKDKKELLIINNFKLVDIKKVNIILSKYLNHYLSKIYFQNKSNRLHSLFKHFVSIKHNFFIKNILKKEYNIIKVFTKSNFSNYKNSILLSRIKYYISSIISKKIEFNIVNLKYLHLNTDILMEALATKLRKKLSLLSVLKKSLFLIKRPSKFSGMLENENSLKMKKLSQIPKDKTYTVVNKNSFLNLYNFNTIDNIINSLKYKWISGIKLEAKGRLTKRYTASRAVYKFVTKGNLKNLDKFYNTEFDLATPSVHLVRNQFKPNLQHTYVYSHKRIGTFGLKGWINSV